MTGRTGKLCGVLSKVLRCAQKNSFLKLVRNYPHLATKPTCKNSGWRRPGAECGIVGGGLGRRATRKTCDVRRLQQPNLRPAGIFQEQAAFLCILFRSHKEDRERYNQTQPWNSFPVAQGLRPLSKK